MFGLPVPDSIVSARGEPVRYWGARAIFTPGSKNPIDLLPDRQQCKCRDDRDPKPLLDWLNKTGLPALRKLDAFQRLDKDSRSVAAINHGQFTLRVCPNSSYGYLYMGAWQYWPERCQYELRELPVIDATTQWSGKQPPPAIGETVHANVNKSKTGRSEWTGVVTGYFVECGWLGVEVCLSKIPDWFKKEHPGDDRGHFFGCDLKDAKAKSTRKAATVR